METGTKNRRGIEKLVEDLHVGIRGKPKLLAEIAANKPSGKLENVDEAPTSAAAERVWTNVKSHTWRERGKRSKNEKIGTSS